jgi:hypothetical protein
MSPAGENGKPPSVHAHQHALEIGPHFAGYLELLRKYEKMNFV